MSSGRSFLLVGGGRWARVYLSVIAGLYPERPVIIVSAHGGQSLAEAVAGLRAKGRAVRLCGDLGSVLQEGNLQAIVANNAHLHVQTALQLLSAKIPVLLEKPFALSRDGAQQLLRASRERSTLLMPGAVLRHCAYLKNFADAARSGLASWRSIEITWRDPSGESRYGEKKSTDTSIGVVPEMGAHVWAVLSTLSLEVSRVTDCHLEEGGELVRIYGEGNCPFTVQLGRGAERRERLVVITDAMGAQARLNFAVEPGVMQIAGQSPHSGDLSWIERPSPLASQLVAFDQRSAHGACRDDLRILDECVTFETAAADKVRKAQHMLLKTASVSRTARQVAAREILAEFLIASGLLVPGETAALEDLTGRALAVIGGGTGGPEALSSVLRQAKLL